MTLKELLHESLVQEATYGIISDQVKSDLEDKLIAYAKVREAKAIDAEEEHNFVKAMKKVKSAAKKVPSSQSDAIEKKIISILKDNHMSSASDGFIKMYLRPTAGSLSIPDDADIPKEFWKKTSKVDPKLATAVLKENFAAGRESYWGQLMYTSKVTVKGYRYVPDKEIPVPVPLPAFDHSSEISEAEKESTPKRQVLALGLIKQQLESELTAIDNYYDTIINRRTASLKQHQKEIQDIDDLLAAGMAFLDRWEITDGNIKLSLKMTPDKGIIFDEDVLPDSCRHSETKIDTAKLKEHVRKETELGNFVPYAKLQPGVALIMS